MKKILFLFVLVTALPAVSQINERLTVEGEIIAASKEEVDGITIRNLTSNEGTITDKKGAFELRVGLNDRLEVSALQFQKFTVIVDKGIIKERELHIFLNESVNRLEEVTVTPYDLSGNIRADISRIPVGKRINAPVQSAGSVIDESYTFTSDDQSRLDNVAEGGNRVRGELNFVNIFKEVWGLAKSKRGKKENIAMDAAVRELYNDQFFKDHLTLEIEEVNEFLLYVEDQGIK